MVEILAVKLELWLEMALVDWSWVVPVGGNDGGEVGETIDIQNVIKDVTVVSNGRVSDVIH